MGIAALAAMLLGCAPGAFVADGDEEPLRAALAFTPDASLSIAAHGTRVAWVLLANSSLPCAPDAAEDDPGTPADEASVAREYWEAQLASLFLREGARAALLVLTVGPQQDWLGRYAVRADAWDPAAAAAWTDAEGRVAAAAWLHVEEAAAPAGDGVLDAPETEVVEAEYALAVDTPAWVDITAKDELIRGTFDFPDAPLAGRFTAARCDNVDLLTALYAGLRSFPGEVE